ncbi:MAG: protein-disulfide reductase DsbD [Gammaproteobacteria bacterium]|nr:protein-disulfide reductase DsbD [Gammaproteobacteria bacterium]
MKKIFALLLLVLAFSVQARPGLLDSLGLSSEFDTPPDVDEAFVFSAQAKDANTILARWAVAEGNYLYKDKIRFELIEQDSVQLQSFSLPAGENKMDEIFGLSEVYQYDVDLILPISRSSTISEITLKAYYQGCSETFRICYPPTEKEVLITLPALTDSLNQTLEPIATTPVFAEQDRIAKSLAEDTLIKILLGFFGLGLLLAFTPCVFPMIPILSSIIVGEGERITTHRAFILSLTYVLAMSITYTAAGVMTGLLGENLQAMFQNPWIIGSFSALFVVLSLSMFGLFELQLPHSLQHRLHQISHQQQGGHIVGAALMGLLSGLIVGPCLAPPLAGALIFIGQHGDPVLGGSALFSLSMGMGLPLIIIGTSAGTLLPKAGDWMNTIKSIFGVLMLALAIWMLERIIPGWVSLLLWGGLLIVSAVYLGALNALGIDASGWEKLWKGLGLILLIYGGLLMIGGASGSHNIWQPLQSVISSQSSAAPTHTGLAFTKINNLTELEQQLAQTNKPAMLDFYADWCVDCKRMEVTTFQDDTVITALENTHALQIDMTANTAEHKNLMKHYGVFAPPTILFFDANGHEYSQHRLVGSISAQDLAQHIATLPQ